MLKNCNGEDNWVGSGEKKINTNKNKKINPAFAEIKFYASSFEISEHLLNHLTGETNPSCNWKAGKAARGLKINKKGFMGLFQDFSCRSAR